MVKQIKSSIPVYTVLSTAEGVKDKPRTLHCNLLFPILSVETDEVLKAIPSAVSTYELASEPVESDHSTDTNDENTYQGPMTRGRAGHQSAMSKASIAMYQAHMPNEIIGCSMQ